MANEDDIALVRSLFERFNAGDLDGAAALATDDFELVDMAAGQTFTGPAGLREWLATFRTALPDATTEIVHVIADGGRVAFEHVGRGTHDGPLATPSGEIPPTGEVRDGRLARMTAYYDSATLLRQLGLMPAPAEQAMTALMGVGVRVASALRRR